jgi:hypothetical protein
MKPGPGQELSIGQASASHNMQVSENDSTHGTALSLKRLSMEL